MKYCIFQVWSPDADVFCAHASGVSGMHIDLQEIFKKVFTAQGVKVAFAEPPITGFGKSHEESPISPQAPEIETTRFAPPEVQAVSPVRFETPHGMEEPTFQTTEEVELEAQMPEVLEPEVIEELGEVRTDETTGLEFETSQHGLGEMPLEEVPSVAVSVYEEEGDQVSDRVPSVLHFSIR